jgi:hypothetical protein
MKWNASKYIIKRWRCRSERSTIYVYPKSCFVNEVYFCRLYFALLIWLSCNYHRKLKSQPMNLPETSLCALVFMSGGQETLAPSSVHWHEQACEFSQIVWSLRLYLSVDWLVKSWIFILASHVLQFGIIYQPRIIFQCFQFQPHIYTYIPYSPAHKTHHDFFVRKFRKKDECILILVIYWKKTELLHTKISNHNIIYSS